MLVFSGYSEHKVATKCLEYLSHGAQGARFFVLFISYCRDHTDTAPRCVDFLASTSGTRATGDVPSRRVVFVCGMSRSLRLRYGLWGEV